jgi:hypothetical protein
VPLPCDADTRLCAQVVKFMLYKQKLAVWQAVAVPRTRSLCASNTALCARSPVDPVPEFKIAPEVVLQLLCAANFLDL